MISIVICATKINIIKDIEKNISSTIGVEFELIVVDNSGSKYSIFQAYNLGVKRSKYPILCFMHDDIVYHSENWGKVVIDYFNYSDTGMIGIGGTRFLSSIPAIWWAGGHKYLNSKSGTICHNCIDTNRSNLNESRYNVINPENKNFTRVAILDGLWFCIRKSLFDRIEFDEINFRGFHFYDLDICMQINKLKLNLYCLFNIKIEHISSSKLDEEWIINCIKFYRKWRFTFPIATIRLSLKQFIHINYKAFRISYNILKSNRIKNPLLFLLINSRLLRLTISYFLSQNGMTLINKSNRQFNECG